MASILIDINNNQFIAAETKEQAIFFCLKAGGFYYLRVQQLSNIVRNEYNNVNEYIHSKSEIRNQYCNSLRMYDKEKFEEMERLYNQPNQPEDVVKYRAFVNSQSIKLYRSVGLELFGDVFTELDTPPNNTNNTNTNDDDEELKRFQEAFQEQEKHVKFKKFTGIIYKRKRRYSICYCRRYSFKRE